ncbi:MAG: molybdenum cofactor biosynthesis protein MoaE [Alphaproteobacteria bacterium]
MSVRVQEEDFDVGAEIAALREGKTSIGGICTFTGLVRDLNEGAGVGAMTLEHYPGMTEKMLREIEEEAHRRWNLDASLIVHRFGTLTAGDQIVLVITASAHRTEAFEACHFLMDWLKTKAPFWKSETLSDGSERWVEARDTDDQAVEKWS